MCLQQTAWKSEWSNHSCFRKAVEAVFYSCTSHLRTLVCPVPTRCWRECGPRANWASPRSPSDRWRPRRSSKTPWSCWWRTWPVRWPNTGHTHTRSKPSIWDNKEKLTSRSAVLAWRLTPGYVWHYLTLCRPLLTPSGTVLRSLHQAQRCQVAAAVRGGALPPPGGVPRPAGERASAPCRIRLQTDVPSLPAEVSAET